MGWRLRNSRFVCFNNPRRVKTNLPTWPLHLSPSRKKGARTHGQGKYPGKASKCFRRSLHFLLASQTTKRETNLVGQAAKKSSGNRAVSSASPTRYPRPPDRPGTHPSQPRPLTAAPHSTARSPPSTRGPPTSATQTALLYDPLALTALTLGSCAAATGRRLTCLPRPLTNPKPRVTPQLARRRAGEGGRAATARGGARAGRNKGRGCPLG